MYSSVTVLICIGDDMSVVYDTQRYGDGNNGLGHRGYGVYTLESPSLTNPPILFRLSGKHSLSPIDKFSENTLESLRKNFIKNLCP